MGSACAATAHPPRSVASDPEPSTADEDDEPFETEPFAESDPVPEPEFTPITVDDTLPREERRALAENAFDRAQRAYELGEWEKAAVLFEEARAYLPDNVPMLFNAGQAWLRAGACCRGAQRLRAYIDLTPADDASRATAEQRLANTRCLCRERDEAEE